MSQTQYSIDQPEAFAGLIAESDFSKKESHLAEGPIDFGLGVEAGTDPERQVKVPSGLGGVVRGISVHQHVEQALVTGVSRFEDKDALPVITKGAVWVQVETSNIGVMAIDDPVYINVAIPGIQLGRLTSVSAGNLLVPTATVKKLATDPDGLGIAKIEINIP